MKKLVIYGIFVALLCVSTTIQADEMSLQEVLNSITTAPVAGVSSINVATAKFSDPFDAYWAIQASGTAASQVIIEIAGNSAENVIGVYDVADPDKKVVLFDGAATAGTKSSLSFSDDGSVEIMFVDSGVDFAGNQFGFYMASPVYGEDNEGGKIIIGTNYFYSDTTLNDDQYDHMWAVQGNGTDIIDLPNSPAGQFAVDEYMLAFEDTFGGGDEDHNDFVFMVESINPVPVPGAILLGLLGMSAAGLKLRKFA